MNEIRDLDLYMHSLYGERYDQVRDDLYCGLKTYRLHDKGERNFQLSGFFQWMNKCDYKHHYDENWERSTVQLILENKKTAKNFMTFLEKSRDVRRNRIYRHANFCDSEVLRFIVLYAYLNGQDLLDVLWVGNIFSPMIVAQYFNACYQNYYQNNYGEVDPKYTKAYVTTSDAMHSIMLSVLRGEYSCFLLDDIDHLFGQVLNAKDRLDYNAWASGFKNCKYDMASALLFVHDYLQDGADYETVERVPLYIIREDLPEYGRIIYEHFYYTIPGMQYFFKLD